MKHSLFKTQYIHYYKFVELFKVNSYTQIYKILYYIVIINNIIADY